MSSVGICALLTRMGYAPIMQISCRDKNRIAIQGDVLGASAMGVQNILCLTGDGVQAGDQPGAKPVSISTACRCSKPSGSCATTRSSCPAAS
jgi:5,10-methylenetetrahydrofolate reductase